ncbi:hypothetical protein [Amycolatopsis sp.]|uniref:hypothetical protein n=1 Tax=Amycolatopsis sp. TaxID=37632 RepID=UPI00263573E9|nr:hypothetical protein [Amycolatopsis sp.]
MPFSLVVNDSPLPIGPLWIYLAVAGTVTALALVATLVPTWVTTRTRPADAAMSGE